MVRLNIVIKNKTDEKKKKNVANSEFLACVYNTLRAHDYKVAFFFVPSKELSRIISVNIMVDNRSGNNIQLNLIN